MVCAREEVRTEERARGGALTQNVINTARKLTQ